MGNWRLVLLIAIFFLSINFISAELEVGIDGEIGLDLIPEVNVTTIVTTVNISNISEKWDAGIGILDTANATQFDSGNGSILNILESWLTTFGNNLWCALTGCEISGDLNVTGNITLGSDILFEDSDLNIWNSTGKILSILEDGTIIPLGKSARQHLGSNSKRFGEIYAGRLRTNWIEHVEDLDTYLGFTTDRAFIYAGGAPMINMQESTQDFIIINDGGIDIDFTIESDIDNKAFYLEGSSGKIGIGTGSPSEILHIVGNIFLQNDSDCFYFGQAKDICINFNGSQTQFTNEVGSGSWVFPSGNVGIGTNIPLLPLHVVGRIYAGDSSSVMIGDEDTGAADDGGNLNVIVGVKALIASISGQGNVAIGYEALRNGNNVRSSVAIGRGAGKQNNGADNVFIGHQAGNNGGDRDVFIGEKAGYGNSGDDNVLLGYQAGYVGDGDRNVFIGTQAGYNEAGSDKLYIESSNSATPLIYGEFDNDIVTFHADVGIGTMTPTQRLDVNGSLNQTNGNSTINMIYGGLIGQDIGEVSIGVQAVYHNVTNVSAQLLNGFNFNASGETELTVQIAGVYEINSGWGFSGSANTEYHLAVGINFARQLDCHTERVIGTGGDVGSASTPPCLKRLNAGDTVNLMIENMDSTTDPTIHSIGLVITRRGN